MDGVRCAHSALPQLVDHTLMGAQEVRVGHCYWVHGPVHLEAKAKFLENIGQI